MSDDSRRTIPRREFLRGGVASGLALGVGTLATRAAGSASSTPAVKGHAVLGRTGLRISDIGFGSSKLSGDEDVVRYALDRGITYFDTAEGYRGGRSEETLGRVLPSVRDQVVITSKVSAGAKESGASLMKRLEGSLRRLKTDRVDIYMNHAVNDVPRISNPEWGEFTQRAREQGKIRFRGMSGHAGHLVECCDYALDHDLVDVMLLAYNFGQDPKFVERFTHKSQLPATQPDLPRILRKAKEKNVGIVAMKTLMGGRKNDMAPYERGGATFDQAALRWTLSDPLVDAAIITMKSPKKVDEFLGASGWRSRSRADTRLLEQYMAENGALECRYGCRECADSCPRDVPISEVLRTRMYARDYRDVDLAVGEYGGLGRGAEACLECSERTCSGACPYGIPIEELAEDTHRWLKAGSLAAAQRRVPRA